MKIVVMGVSGCGKSTIGDLLAKKYGGEFLDGDDLHPLENVTKMSQGIPLKDEDRWPWLDIVGNKLKESDSIVIACSALKKSYRTRILALAPETTFIHLHGSKKLLQERLNNRAAHFMPSTLLNSQIETLEDLESGEPGFQVDIDQSTEEIIHVISTKIDSGDDKLSA